MSAEVRSNSTQTEENSISRTYPGFFNMLSLIEKDSRGYRKFGNTRTKDFVSAIEEETGELKVIVVRSKRKNWYEDRFSFNINNSGEVRNMRAWRITNYVGYKSRPIKPDMGYIVRIAASAIQRGLR